MALITSALSRVTNKLNAISSLILATPATGSRYFPQSQDTELQQPPPSLVFHYDGEQSVSLDSDITDHFVEDNTSIQDQIGLPPETVSTHGFIGELNDVVPAVLAPIKSAADRLTAISGFVPGLSATALRQFQQAQFAFANSIKLRNAAIAAISSIRGTTKDTQTKQQEYFSLLYGYWRNRTLFTVQTPWGVFQNMAIKSIRSIQGPDTRMVTDFEVTFKAIRFAESIVSDETFDSSNTQNRLTSQSAAKVFLGNVTPKTSEKSFASLISDLGKASVNV